MTTSIEEFNQGIMDMYSHLDHDALHMELAKAQARLSIATKNYQRHYLASDKIFIEDAQVRINNINFVISERDKHQSLKDAVSELKANNFVIKSRKENKS